MPIVLGWEEARVCGLDVNSTRVLAQPGNPLLDLEKGRVSMKRSNQRITNRALRQRQQRLYPATNSQTLLSRNSNDKVVSTSSLLASSRHKGTSSLGGRTEGEVVLLQLGDTIGD